MGLRRVVTPEAFKRRYATQILGIGNHGLKSTAIIAASLREAGANSTPPTF